MLSSRYTIYKKERKVSTWLDITYKSVSGKYKFENFLLNVNDLWQPIIACM